MESILLLIASKEVRSNEIVGVFILTIPQDGNQSEPKIAIKVQEITKSFNLIAALTNVSFEVYEGEVYGLLGPNGAGKTTTIRILKGMLKPTTGDAFIFDKI